MALYFSTMIAYYGELQSLLRYGDPVSSLNGDLALTRKSHVGYSRFVAQYGPMHIMPQRAVSPVREQSMLRQVYHGYFFEETRYNIPTLIASYTGYQGPRSGYGEATRKKYKRFKYLLTLSSICVI
jgi:hypothetical protein